VVGRINQTLQSMPLLPTWSTNECSLNLGVHGGIVRAGAKKYAVVLPSFISVKESLMKMDRKRPLKYKKGGVPIVSADRQTLLEYSLDYVESKFCIPLECDITWPKFERGAVSGLPYKPLGYKTKGSVLDSSECMGCLDVFEYPALYKMSPKVEILELDEIKSNKIRTFFPAPFHLAFWSGMVCEPQNDRCKNHWWSKYGMVMCYGGFQQLFSDLNHGSSVAMFDISGLDRDHPLMEWIWSLRLKYIKLRQIGNYSLDSVTKGVQWAKNNTVRQYMVFPDGVVVRRDTGNPSGGKGTTVDNIVCVCAALSFAFVCAFFDKNGRRPTFGELDTINAGIFGDDSAYSYDRSFDKMDDASYIAGVFSELNLTIKEGTFVRVPTKSLEMEKISFLGASFKLVKCGGEVGVVPFFKPDRLYAGLLYQKGGKLSKMETMNKVLSLLYWSVGDWNCFQVIASIYKQLLRDNFYEPSCKGLVENGVVDYPRVFDFWTKSPSGFEIFPLGLDLSLV